MKLLMKKRARFTLTGLTVAIATYVSLPGCNIHKKDHGSSSSSTSVLNFNTTTGSDGRGSLRFSLPSGTTKFSVTAEANAAVRIDNLSADGGSNFLPSGISLGSEFLPSVNTASAPSRSIDPDVIDSKQVSVTVQTATGSNGRVTAAPNIPVAITVNTKADSDLGRGTLQLNVFFVGNIGSDSDARSAVASALDVMRGIYSGDANVDLNVTEIDVSGPDVLPDTTRGSSFYKSASSTAGNVGVNIFIGTDVGITLASGELLGVASSIPGPPIPSARSAVAVSITNSAGPDGRFSGDEEQLLGETIAHETGHFMGLFHPIEIDITSGTVTDVDPLPDTPTCSTKLQCLNDDTLIHNLMFPLAVANGNGGTVRQNRLTEQQSGVLNRYIGVD